MKLAQVHDMSTLHKDLQLSRNWQGEHQTALRGDEEGAIENVRGDDRGDFLTISDNVPTVGGLAGGEERAAILTLTQEAS